IRNGKLRLSMADTLALAIENNLDIAVQRFLHPIAEADILRASSGQAARGIAGALVPVVYNRAHWESASISSRAPGASAAREALAAAVELCRSRRWARLIHPFR